MIGWWKRRLYRNDVVAQVAMMTLLIGRDGRLLDRHAGIKGAVQASFEEGTPPMVAATHIAAAIVAYAIEQDDDTIRKQIVAQQLTEWSILQPNEQRAFVRQLAGGSLDQDMLLTRCQWLLVRGQDLLLNGKITEHDFRILKDAIYGPLKGEPSQSRMFARIDSALDEAFGLRTPAHRLDPHANP